MQVQRVLPCRIRAVDLEVVAAEEVVVEDVDAQAVLGDKVGEERFPTRVAAVEVLPQEGGAEDLSKKVSVIRR